MRHAGMSLLALLAALALASPAASQPDGTKPDLPSDLGVVVRYTIFDSEPDFDDAIGIGGRAMAFFHPRWGLEVDATYTPTDGPAQWPDVSVFTLHGRVLYGLPLSDSQRSHLLFGLGFAHNYYAEDAAWQDSGIGGLVGLRLGLGRRWNIRFDGTYDYMPGSGDQFDFGHMGLQAGIGWNPLWYSSKHQ